MTDYIRKKDGSLSIVNNTKQEKKKKNILDHGIDFAKNVFNLPSNTIKGIYNSGKKAIDEVNGDGYQFGDLTQVGLKTIGNTATKLTHGAGKAIENFYDFTVNASSNINTNLSEKLGIQTKEQAANERKAAQNIIKRDLTTDAENWLGWDDELRKDWEKGSLVKKDNLAGQVVESIGEMMPTLIVGNAVGSVPSNATKVQKLISAIPTTQTLGMSSYGGALETAYNEGATTSQANKYAFGSALTEVATEWLTGGVPGVNDAGILDNLEEKTLNKVSNNLAKFLIKEGYNVVGEGAEEALSEIINPYLKNATYAHGQQVNWNDVIQAALIGGITGGILDLPGNVSTYRANTNIQQQNQANLKEKTQNNINLPTAQNVSQNGLNVPINENINTNQNNDINLPTVENTNPLENLQEFSQRQEQVRNQQVQEDTNRRINTLEQQLEQQGSRILEESESQREAMIESFKEYLEEHNITNPTQQDINDSITDIMSYDNDLDFADTARAEQLYNKYVKEYMQENGIPFNNEIKTVQPLNKRVSGDELLDAQDLIDEVKSVGAKVDDNGYITVYHQTTPEAAQEIRNTGRMISNEPYVYFSTSENASQADGRGQVKLEFRIPAESLILDDIFSDNADVKIKLNGKNLDVSNYIVNNQPSIPTARDFNRINLPTVEKNSDMVYNDVSNLRQRNNFDFDVQEGDLVNEFHDELSPREWVEYHSKMNKVLNSTYGDFTRLDLINGKLVETVFENGKEQVVDIIHPNGDVAYLTNYVMDEVNNGKYSHEQIQRFVEEMFGEGNFTRNNPTNNIDKSNEEQRNDSRQVNEDSRYGNRITDETNNSKTNRRELENSSFSLPTKENNKTSMPMAKTDDVLRIASQNIAKQINGAGGFDLKQRSWVETATESDILKDKVYIEDLEPGKISYVVQSNKKSLDSANKHLETYGYDKTLDYVKNIMQSDKLPSASDVALMQRMIQEASKRGDAETVQDLIMDTAIVGTDLGQATQALSIIQKLTPEGQLKMYTKLVQRAKARGEKSFQNVEITPEMVQNILEAYDKNGNYDQDDLNARVEKFKQDIADQMKSTVGEKIDAWRYLSMLGNPKTHIRNMVSNIAMTGTIKVKNAMARTLETVLPVKNRTKTWKAASQDIKEYSRKTANDMKGIITGENKYNEKSAIESKKQIFKSKVLEKLSTLNGNALEGEDWFFSKRAFQNTLQEYLTANGINTYEDIESNPELVEKAKLYAVEQAEIATFRQYSKLASEINKIERKNKGARLAIQALVPFKKTPINVAKAGVNYSPLGLSKNLTYDLWQLTHGNMEASQFIDKLSQGLTGTSLTLLGYALAKAGILTGSGGDDKDDKYDKQLGKTGYSLNIGGNSYSISWLSPVAMPMLVGSNAYEQLEEQKEWDMNVVSDTLAKTLDPLNEMSFMQGLTNALNSYGSGVDKWKGALESTGQNYVGQFFPTLFSQIAATTDDKKRSTKASNNSKYKFGEQTVRSVMYKIPGLRQQLEVATDVWGNEKKQSSNIIERAFESFIAPYTKTENISTKLDNEIKRVYSETGESGVIPSIPYAYVRYKNETYRMSANDYTRYKKTYGQKANKLLTNLISSDAYKNANDNMKAKMIDNIYDYAKAEANSEFFKGTGVDYTSDTLKELNKLKELNIKDNTLAEYVSNKTQVSSIRNSSNYTTEEKKKQVSDILTNSKLENKQLAYLYGKYYSTAEKLNALSGANIPIKEFIKYDLTDFTSDYNARTGKAISGSKEKKVINYINQNLKLSAAQKALLIKMEYNSFKGYDSQIVNYVKSSGASYLDKAYLLKRSGFNNYDTEIINYVKQHYSSAKEREEILKNLGFTIRNGRVYK